VGACVGTDGKALGINVGCRLGFNVGLELGEGVGELVGDLLGVNDGTWVGFKVDGAKVGS